MVSKAALDKLKHAQTDKELKSIFKKIASKNPDEYFPTKELNDLGYKRKHCECCGNYFWTTLKERKGCGEPTCSGKDMVKAFKTFSILRFDVKS